jgi:hypothetical protein
VGCEALRIDERNRQARLGDAGVREGDWVSVDGGTGEVFLGQRKIVTKLPEAELHELDRWQANSAAARQSADRNAVTIRTRYSVRTRSARRTTC